ncbi:MAG: alpha/beta hydrolase [Roseiarcus sp.]|jgi:lysophospholipase
MRLVSIPDNPIPTGAIVASARAVDGVKLRTARWVPSRPPRGTVAVLGGRADFIEKYFETIRQLLDRGLAVAAMDWRGQGGSARQLKNPRKGHIDDFSLYERDLDALVSEVLDPSCPRPWYGLCHSMGAAILLAVARAGRCPFDRLVLASPMIAFARVKRPRAARLFVEALDAVGLGGAFAPGGGAKIVVSGPFAGNPLTSDPTRYARMSGVVAADPELGLGRPTVSWLHAAFRLMREFEDPDFPRRTLTPILAVASGADRVVDTRATERFASRLRAGRLIVVDGAEHEIMMERDIFRDRFWAAFDSFIPGVEGEKARAAP